MQQSTAVIFKCAQQKKKKEEEKKKKWCGVQGFDEAMWLFMETGL